MLFKQCPELLVLGILIQDLDDADVYFMTQQHIVPDHVPLLDAKIRADLLAVFWVERGSQAQDGGERRLLKNIVQGMGNLFVKWPEIQTPL